MKPNEWVLTIVQLMAPIFAFATGNIAMGIFLSEWVVVFGINEILFKKFTGKTLSGHVWSKKAGAKWYEKDKGTWEPRPMWQKVTLSAIMVAGMLALGFHFIWG